MAASRARTSSRTASCPGSGTQMAVSSPARCSRAKLRASRRLVFTRYSRLWMRDCTFRLTRRLVAAECEQLVPERGREKLHEPALDPLDVTVKINLEHTLEGGRQNRDA